MKRTSIKKNVVCVIYGITIAATSYAAGSDLSGEMRPEHPGIALSKAINEGKLPVVESVIAPPAVHTPPSRSLNEIPLFSNPIVTDEYKSINTPFTLAVTEQEVGDALIVLPSLNQRQQELGFNSWPVAGADGRGFHRSAESWNDRKYDEYFEQGIMREIVFLLTGVGERGVNKTKDYSAEAQMRIILSLCKEMETTHHRASRPFMDSVIKSIKKRNAIYTQDSSGKETFLPFPFIEQPKNPVGYEKYKFNATDEDTERLYWFTFCVEHVVIETMKALSTDPTALRLARQFHKQKLIEERLSDAQYKRMDGTNTDGHKSIVGEAFTRERNLAEIANRALFWLIEAKIRHALEVYIFPLKAEVSVGEDGEFEAPVFDADEMRAYQPDFMENPALKKILDAEYIPIS